MFSLPESSRPRRVWCMKVFPVHVAYACPLLAEAMRRGFWSSTKLIRRSARSKAARGLVYAERLNLELPQVAGIVSRHPRHHGHPSHGLGGVPWFRYDRPCRMGTARKNAAMRALGAELVEYERSLTLLVVSPARWPMSGTGIRAVLRPDLSTGRDVSRELFRALRRWMLFIPDWLGSGLL